MLSAQQALFSVFQLRGGFGFGFRQNLLQRNRNAALALAFVRGFHEREDLDRLLGANRWLPRFEKPADLAAKVSIISALADLKDRLAAINHRAERGFAAMNAAISANPPVLPHTSNEVEIFRRDAADGFAASSHDREQRLDAVD